MATLSVIEISKSLKAYFRGLMSASMLKSDYSSEEVHTVRRSVADQTDSEVASAEESESLQQKATSPPQKLGRLLSRPS